MPNNNYLQKAVNWLEQHRIANAVIATGYFVFIYFMHPYVANLSVLVQHSLSLPVYNATVLVITLLLGLGGSAYLLAALKTKTPNRNLQLIYLFASIAFIIIHFRVMFEMNIEIIHIFEFSILSFLLFPFTRRFGAAVLFTVPFMLLDEWHQYV
ncbi:MAG TPA: hypothetical protein VG603_11105, partial [Chitinophagales bacterium]|nr:hypothetical protein [Chitinophagales bacterium]